MQTTENSFSASLTPRIALFSIIGFWAFYFAITTARSAVFNFGHPLGMLGRRTIVSLACVAITYLFYLLLRRRPTASLKRSIITAALLAIPGAVLYSSVNWFVFEDINRSMQATWQHSSATNPAGAPIPPHPSITAITANGIQIMIPPTPPAPPAVATAPSGHHSEEDDMTPLQMIADNSWNGYFLFVAWASLYLALCYAAEVGALERRAATLSAAAQAAELRALRYQVNPHFLFNTLNSLSSLVLTGKREMAEKMIMNLSTFFRTSLSGEPTDDVPLSEEICLQRLYLDIEAVRFPERLVVDIAVPDALLSACVPGLILQPLVENAVKYGVSRARRPVTIRIRARKEGEMLVLTVEDDGEPMPVGRIDDNGTGVGLHNVRDRLAVRFGDAADCRWEPRPGGGFAVTLTMPLVHNGPC